MVAAASASFNAQAEGGNGLTASELTNRPISEWDSIIAGRQPDDLATFTRNLRNTFEQEFSEVLNHRKLFNLNSEIKRLRAEVVHPRGPEDFSDNPEIQKRIGEIFEKGQADPQYGPDQLRQDMERARDEVMEKVDGVIKGFENAAPAASASAERTVEAQRPAMSAPGLSV